MTHQHLKILFKNNHFLETCSKADFHLTSAESPVSPAQKSQFIYQHSRSVIGARRANALNIQLMLCKEVFHKLKHVFCFGGCFQFFTEKEVLLHGTIVDIPHQYNKFTSIQSTSSFL